MQNKDQRVEFRISSDDLDKVDLIVKDSNPLFKYNRSDVIRRFVSQGISNHLNNIVDIGYSKSLIDRLNLFFLTQPNDSQSFKLVRYVYENDLNWFFHLNKENLKKLIPNLSYGEIGILKLMSHVDNDGFNDIFEYVFDVADVFWKIGLMLDGSPMDEYLRLQERAGILGYPTEFYGFGEKSVIYNQMVDVISIYSDKKVSVNNYSKKNVDGRYDDKYGRIVREFLRVNVYDLPGLIEIFTHKLNT